MSLGGRDEVRWSQLCHFWHPPTFVGFAQTIFQHKISRTSLMCVLYFVGFLLSSWSNEKLFPGARTWHGLNSGGCAMRTNGLRKSGQFALLMVILATGFAFGQNANTGEIKGTVTDPSGAVIDGVTVTIANTETGVSIVRTTNSAGIYDSPSVPIGSYTITFSKTGFKDLVRKGLTLQIQTLGLDATLQVGNATETITVTSEAPLLETETSDQRVNLSSHAIRTAPIVGTDWRAELVQLIP